ncbi:type I-C CRISPR-associated protein Cas8c/Csd1 [Methylomonas sp. BW4-1]|uniref:type I-C CRISPR-associated protein Cas8c/Csd1 n=1 Tax=Methylomonas sp. BW4-1 TaxID=3376685 RepID=UPI0040415313
MSWLQKLYQTYDAGVLLDLPLEQQLMPISHTPQNAHINIVLDAEGNFRRASVLEKTQIVLPATESSASRSSGEAPHGLADKIQYVAKDYAGFGGKKKAYFESYRQQLNAWCESPYAHPKVQAVYRYIEKGTVVADLIAQQILFAETNAQGVPELLERWQFDDAPPALFKVLPKEKGILDQGAALVCWSVEIPGNSPSETWKDPSIQACWIRFDTANSIEKSLCYATGVEQVLSNNHPAKIRHSGDKAKLISSNDSSGYTYRGRFLDETQACGIGFEVSQKAHNALRWLVNRQGFRNGDQVYVAWAVSGAQVPQPLADSGMANDSDDFDLEEVAEPVIINVQVDHGRNLGQAYARKLSQYMAGYAAKISHNEQITVMGIDSATPGRMSIIYYRELLRDEFFQRLQAWHTQFAWRQRHNKDLPVDNDKKTKSQVIWPICAPLPRDIAVAAHGENLDDALKKKVLERLLPCIIDEAPIPRDLMELCLRKVSNRVAYPSDKHWLWEKNLGIACALIKGYYQRHPDTQLRRDYAMALEENCPDRDYLFGRLLAVADYIEEIAQGVGGEKRPTTAARLMQRFADRPFETWRTIELSLQPYMQRLQVSRAGFLTNRNKDIDRILALFQHDDFTRNAALSGEFLLGYHCQRHHYKHKPESNPASAEGHDANLESGE